MDNRFFQSLNENTVVLTSNRRLANYLQHEYTQYQRSQHNVAWITPNIIPLSSWLERLWKTIGDQRQPLTAIQEYLLWKKVSQQHWTSIPTIQQAWNTLQAWDMNSEAQSIFQWAADFQRQCQAQHWISSAEIPHQLLHSKKLFDYLPQSIFLIGFDDFPPIINKLFDTLKCHTSIEIIKAHSLPKTIKRIELENPESELYAMASWALKEYQDNSRKKIACVVPNLSTSRTQVVHIFSEVFPDNSMINISAGQYLNEFLIIQTALQLLCNNWEGLLQSPYLTQSDDDLDVGAFVDKMRRSQNVLRFEDKDLLPFFTSIHAHFPQSTYLKRWKQLVLFKKMIPELQTLRQWLHTFTEILTILQWPGTRTLSSLEHQVLNRWLKALDELMPCSTLFNNINANTALKILNQHISHIIFQPKSEEAAIQVLGILETAGMSFDTMWVMSLDNEHWPPPASPNPFLPYALQIQHNMPHASAVRELQFSQQIMQRLLSSAKDIYLSYSRLDGDRPLAASQLIPSVATVFNQSNEKKKYLKSTKEWHSSLETLEDSFGEILSEPQKLSGGVNILKFQALCPFKAFATFRLGANRLETPTLGLSAKVRGRLLHQALEYFWRSVQSQDYLLAMNNEKLNKTISTAIYHATKTEVINPLDQKFLNTEKKRLQKVIQSWVSIEKKRSPFKVIAQESKRLITINALSFQCRIDRIDQLSNGSRMIIDYKSNNNNRIQDWFTDRPPDPQLPIYCVYGDKTVYDSLAFAQVYPGSMTFKGISHYESEDNGIDYISDIKNINGIDHWHALTSHWRTTLENLSDAFFQGKASVDPLKSACDYCELNPLCRINECQH